MGFVVFGNNLNSFCVWQIIPQTIRSQDEKTIRRSRSRWRWRRLLKVNMSYFGDVRHVGWSVRAWYESPPVCHIAITQKWKPSRKENKCQHKIEQEKSLNGKVKRAWEEEEEEERQRTTYQNTNTLPTFCLIADDTHFDNKNHTVLFKTTTWLIFIVQKPHCVHKNKNKQIKY